MRRTSFHVAHRGLPTAGTLYAGEAFAVCPIHGDSTQAVEPVLDSSRYFVLRIEDGKGHHAFIGMGFTERDDAFKFKVALQDHSKYVQVCMETGGLPSVLASQSK